MEEAWLEDCLTNGKAKSVSGAKDTVTMRKIATGRSQTAIESTESLSSKTVNGMNWITLQQGLQKGTRPLTPLTMNGNNK